MSKSWCGDEWQVNKVCEITPSAIGNIYWSARQTRPMGFECWSDGSETITAPLGIVKNTLIWPPQSWVNARAQWCWRDLCRSFALLRRLWRGWATWSTPSFSTLTSWAQPSGTWCLLEWDTFLAPCQQCRKTFRCRFWQSWPFPCCRCCTRWDAGTVAGQL